MLCTYSWPEDLACYLVRRHYNNTATAIRPHLGQTSSTSTWGGWTGTRGNAGYHFIRKDMSANTTACCGICSAATASEGRVDQ